MSEPRYYLLKETDTSKLTYEEIMLLIIAIYDKATWSAEWGRLRWEKRFIQ